MTTIEITKTIDILPDVLFEYLLNTGIQFINKLKAEFDSRELLNVFFKKKYNINVLFIVFSFPAPIVFQ